MHYSIPGHIARFIRASGNVPGTVLDVGGADVNGGSGKEWSSRGWAYHSADCDPMAKVNFHLPADSRWNLGRKFDVVFSTSTIEHCAEPWVLVPTMAQHVKPGGWLFLIAPWAWPIHRYPKDYWRFGPDGMEVLFNLAGVPVLKSGVTRELFWGLRALHGIRPFISGLIGRHASHIDCWAWGRKPV